MFVHLFFFIIFEVLHLFCKFELFANVVKKWNLSLQHF